TLKGARRNAAIKEAVFLLLGVFGLAALDGKRVLLDLDGHVVFAETGDRHSHAIGVFTGALDIVGRVGLRRIIEAGQRIEQAEHPVKADRRAIKRAEIKTTHLLVLLQKRRGSRASETRRWAGCQALTDPYGV